jgi:hypothetical protein
VSPFPLGREKRLDIKIQEVNVHFIIREQLPRYDCLSLILATLKVEIGRIASPDQPR